MKLGKLPATQDARDLRFSSYRSSTHKFPALPHEFGHEHAVRDWGMLGNDVAGNAS